MKTRILVTHQRYFVLHARMFRAGAERALARISGVPPENARFDLRSLSEDFRVDGPASEALLRAFLTGGLLQSESAAGSYRPTTRFREYALARVVAPLSRTRADTRGEEARARGARHHAVWAQ